LPNSQQSCDGPRRHPAPAKQLHVDVVAAEQHQVGIFRHRFGGNGGKPIQIAGMRPDMQIGQEDDAQRPGEPRPARNRKRVSLYQMRLGAREALKEAFAAALVGKRRPHDHGG
jgi:hypothetical protein